MDHAEEPADKWVVAVQELNKFKNMFKSITPVAYAHTNDDFFGHHMMMYDDYGLGLWGPIFMFIFWIIIIVIAIIVIKYLFEQNRSGQSNNKAEDILKERYAKGEIDKKEFEEKMKNIRK